VEEEPDEALVEVRILMAEAVAEVNFSQHQYYATG